MWTGESMVGFGLVNRRLCPERSVYGLLLGSRCPGASVEMSFEKTFSKTTLGGG